MTRILITLLALVSLFACGGGGSDAVAPGGGSGGVGELELQVSDKPFDHSIVKHALVRVRRVDVHKSGGSGSGFHTLYSGPGVEFDLVTLQAGVTSLLIRADVPAGTYDQIRLYINSAQLELVNGKVYSTSAGDLQLTSLNTSGLKLMLSPNVEVVTGLSRALLLDFDMTKTFHPVPANDPLAAKKYQLKPHIKVANLSDSGNIRGVVTEDDGTGTHIPVVGATVYLMPPGVHDPAQSLASTGTVAGGKYALLGVAPQSYDVLATFGDKQAQFGPIAVSVGNAVTVDLFVQ